MVRLLSIWFLATATCWLLAEEQTPPLFDWNGESSISYRDRFDLDFSNADYAAGLDDKTSEDLKGFDWDLKFEFAQLEEIITEAGAKRRFSEDGFSGKFSPSEAPPRSDLEDGEMKIVDPSLESLRGDKLQLNTLLKMGSWAT